MYKNRKTNPQQSTKSSIKLEYQRRRILFLHGILGQEITEDDLILALNKVLLKAEEGLDTWFYRVRYGLFEPISVLLTKKANVGLLIPRLSNVLIWIIKTVDFRIVEIEVLEHWQWLKVHGMRLERYLGEGMIELSKREVEFSLII